MYAYITPDGLGKGGEATINISGTKGKFVQRGHHLGKGLGGPGNIPQNLAPEQGHTNQGIVRDWEDRVANVVRGTAVGVPQQNVRIMKFPLYEGDNLVSDKSLLIAFGEKGFQTDPVYVLNK